MLFGSNVLAAGGAAGGIGAVSFADGVMTPGMGPAGCGAPPSGEITLGAGGAGDAGNDGVLAGFELSSGVIGVGAVMTGPKSLFAAASSFSCSLASSSLMCGLGLRFNG